MPMCNTFRDKRYLLILSGYDLAMQRAIDLKLHYVVDQPKVIE